MILLPASGPAARARVPNASLAKTSVPAPAIVEHLKPSFIDAILDNFDVTRDPVNPCPAWQRLEAVDAPRPEPYHLRPGSFIAPFKSAFGYPGFHQSP